MRAFFIKLVLIAAVAAGAALATYFATRPVPPSMPPSATVLQSVREVARLETLDVPLYKKVQFKPDPPQSDALIEQLWNWARYNVRPPEGRAIVFGVARLSLDLVKLEQDRIRTTGTAVWLVLPPMQSRVEIKPDETEIIDSSLDSRQTAALFAMAKEAMEHDIAADNALQDRARRSAERAIRALLVSFGFQSIHFVEELPAELSAGG